MLLGGSQLSSASANFRSDQALSFWQMPIGAGEPPSA
jgi:hypothetical protein